MLGPECGPIRRVVPAVRSGLRWRALLRLGALLAGGVAVILWPHTQATYGVWFLLWIAALAVYAGSFTRATGRYPELSLRTLAWLLAIVGLAVALRAPGIKDLPANISIDELLPGLEAAHIARGSAPNVFSSIGWFTMPNLSFAFPALVMKVAGAEAFVPLRVSSLLTGIGGLLCTFLLARRLLGDRVALIAAFLMASSFWHIHNSRTGFPFVQSSFWPALVLYLVVRACQDSSDTWLAVAGLCWGLALQCYFPVRILIVLCPLFLVADWLAQRDRIGTMVAQAAIVAVAALLALGPLLRSVPWAELTERSRGVLLTDPGVLAELAARYRVHGLPAVLWRNVGEAASMFTDWADVAVLNHSPSGLLDTGTLVALVAGTLIALLQGRVYPLLLVAWAALTFIGGVVLSNAPRASYRLAPAMPALFILAGLGIERLLLVSAPPWRWYRMTVRPLLLAGLAVWVVMQNHRLFFVDYFKGDGHETIHSVALRFMSSHCDGRQFYFISAEAPGPEVELFCPAYRVLDAGQIASAVDITRPATFIIPRPDQAALARLRQCYPAAQVHEHYAADRRFLFTRVDAGVADLGVRCALP